MSDLITAGILGIVEGLTEFIPVSSTGHLILAGDVLKFSGSSEATFEICIQTGGILAVLVLYWQRFVDLFKLSSPIHVPLFQGLRGWMLLAAGCAPGMLVGLLFHDVITKKLFSPIPVAIALIVGGVLMLIFQKLGSRQTQQLDHITLSQAITVGCVQVLSLWPGISRSGSSIIGGLLCGMSKEVSAQFSFLLAVPMLSAATAYELYKNYHSLSTNDLPLYAVGFTTAFLVSIVAIRFFLDLLQRFSFTPFALYRIMLGTAVLLWLE